MANSLLVSQINVETNFNYLIIFYLFHKGIFKIRKGNYESIKASLKEIIKQSISIQSLSKKKSS
jgi:hypothetical protein